MTSRATPLYVRQALCGNPYATKHEVAKLLVERFPELAGYRTNRSPRSERYWLNMFDAVAVAEELEAGEALSDDDTRRARAA